MDHDEAPQPAPRTFLKSQIGTTHSIRSANHPTEDYKRCRLCAGHHALRVCPAFLGVQPQQRFLLARAHKYCTNCLALSHPTAQCTSTTTCRTCSLQHHTLLHRNGTPAARRTRANSAVQPPKRLDQTNKNAPQRGGSGRTSPPYNHTRHHPTRGNRKVRFTGKGFQTAGYRSKATKILVHEAMRALRELKDALAA
ncbi:PREDICTED: uncharacterized protein LOC108359893 [Rhagoletis zephyria]|uniref:uncharacterized protein LOC108359893 n=1 Tax=Rhagoletis zephyria TaxID=28612 RepID=UPI0008115A9C|nr:PREDICTED: uncharacterized protein LOC108359893 [Rhagoletis zephyria]XP_017467459.1 PREDICTED: uncharacterized protein LOC108359893 [Rhagoletis zephyria]XP_036340434.1 uncharacterized protein LOC118749762 [Rhagoletis pomonella]XP_036340435.1 uncharacterized protein LOC118749762 [Rhagoletis pomonella]